MCQTAGFVLSSRFSYYSLLFIIRSDSHFMLAGPAFMAAMFPHRADAGAVFEHGVVFGLGLSGQAF
jgi:hypothetical protein